ncbi:hypothetical protein H9Q73_010274 [Fusarium xylarioides]|nr:hypothetical protein H9Q73_010274 [Fusarium xylarioides]
MMMFTKNNALNTAKDEVMKPLPPGDQNPVQQPLSLYNIILLTSPTPPPPQLGVAQEEEENEFNGQPLSQPESPPVIATHFELWELHQRLKGLIAHHPKIPEFAGLFESWGRSSQDSIHNDAERFEQAVISDILKSGIAKRDITKTVVDEAVKEALNDVEKCLTPAVENGVTDTVTTGIMSALAKLQLHIIVKLTMARPVPWMTMYSKPASLN